MKKIILLSILKSIVLLGFSQTQIIYLNHITAEDGLSAPWARCMLQDRKGFIWIGSNGLNKYDGYKFTHYMPDEDNPNSVRGYWIGSLMEDDNGLLWIGTTNGLTILDPETEIFLRFHDTASNYSIEGISKIYLSHKNEVWIGAGDGLSRFSPKDTARYPSKEAIYDLGVESVFTITNFNQQENQIIEGFVTSIFEDSSHNLWVGTDKNTYIFKDGNEKDIKTTDTPWANCVLEINETEYLLGLYSNLMKLENVNFWLDESYSAIQKLNPKNYNPVGNAFVITSLLKDRNQNLWAGVFTFGMEGGLMRIIKGRSGDLAFENFSFKTSSSNSIEAYTDINCIMEDRSGLIWQGYEHHGISNFSPESQYFKSYIGLLKHKIENWRWSDIYIDKWENLWIGTYGGGLYQINLQNYETSVYKPVLEMPSAEENMIESMAYDESGCLWVGSAEGLFRFDMNKKIFKKIYAKCDIPDCVISNQNLYELEIKDNYLYLGTLMSGVSVYNISTGKIVPRNQSDQVSQRLMNSTVEAICITRKGEVWMGTNFQGIHKIEINRETNTTSFVPLPVKGDKNNYKCMDIIEDHQGYLWVGTASGLLRANPETGEILQFSYENGYDFINVMSLQVDHNNNLWLGTSSGLFRFDTKSFRSTRFTANSGLPVMTHTQSASLYHNDFMYFACSGGFYSFHPDSIKTNTYVPEIVITDFKLFNETVKPDTLKSSILSKNISYTRKIELRHNQNDISFEFAALSYHDPSANKYAYKLEGYHDKWIPTDSKHRFATFTNLDPGNYSFVVKGSNNDGLWNETGTSIDIVIHSPWWKTRLAYISYFILTVLLLGGIIQLRTWRLRKERNLLEKQVKERTKKIREQKEKIEESNEELLQQKEELQTTLENLQKTQEQLIESEKMAALGGLVAGVAHEINTPVGITITAASGLLEETVRMADLYRENKISKGEFKQYLNNANQAVKLIMSNMEKAAALVQSFKQISVDQALESKRVFKLKEYTEDIIRSLYPKLKNRKISVAINIDDKLTIDSYPGAYSQVITNLVLNSLIHGFEEKQDGEIGLNAEGKQSEVVLTYRDNGKGIEKEDLKKIFDPFFTTNKKTGTGLGLHIVYNLVTQKLEGTIECRSRQGEGVLFTIKLPFKK